MNSQEPHDPSAPSPRSERVHAQQAGFRAELSHQATFNARATRVGSPLRAQLTAPGAAADLWVWRGQEVVAQVQVKTYRRVPATTRAIAQRQYSGMQRVVPADQVAGVRSLAQRRGVDALSQRDYPAVAGGAQGSVEVGKLRSRPLTYREAQSRQLGRRLVALELGQAARSGALFGAALGAGAALLSQAGAVRAHEKSLRAAAVDTVLDTLRSGAEGALSAVTTSGLTMACARVGLRAGGAPAALTGMGFGLIRDVSAHRRGELMASALLGRSVEHLAQAGGGWAGAGVGAAVGTAVLPGPGTVIGSLLGGVLGGSGSQSVVALAQHAWRARRGEGGKRH